MAGTVYTVAPIPADAAHTTYIDAGAVRFGVEFRLLDDADLTANYAGRDLAEVRAAVGDKNIEDDGVSLHVVGSDDGHEYLRFDMFERQPHYHYIERGTPKNTIVEYDAVAMGDMLTWVLAQLRARMAEMLTYAGGAALASRLERERIDGALREVARLVSSARASMARRR